MRKIGIDYGSKRVGIALTDEAGLMAFPHVVLENNQSLLKEVIKIIEENEVSEMVIGYSLGRDGQPNEIHKAVESFMTDITLERPIPIHLEPEQYTTQEAIRFQGRNKDTDASAAAIILNSFITRKK
ncbi:Holliday junction resolvase RuvX [Candidatus Kaiserbacteria bacterium]|nr:Holliday junction resolvase RuvX [Candidatus Kaiserbacteria bacterium]